MPRMFDLYVGLSGEKKILDRNSAVVTSWLKVRKNTHTQGLCLSGPRVDHKRLKSDVFFMSSGRVLFRSAGVDIHTFKQCIS